MKKTKRLVLLAMLTAVAMILSYVESLLPSVGIPGVKMGLANIAVIFALFRFGWKEAAALSLVRVVLVSLLRPIRHAAFALHFYLAVPLLRQQRVDPAMMRR